MRVLRSFAMSGVVLSVVAVLVARPPDARAQCAMGGGGHDHGAARDASAKKPASSATKQRKAADKLLSDEDGRNALADAILNDRDFMKAFVARLLETPEWRDLVSETLKGTAASVSGGKPEVGAAPTYVCPMHPDIVASKAGRCPKCGMTLERRGPPDATPR